MTLTWTRLGYFIMTYISTNPGNTNPRQGNTANPIFRNTVCLNNTEQKSLF